MYDFSPTCSLACLRVRAECVYARVVEDTYHHCTCMFRIIIIQSLRGLTENSILMRRAACVKYLLCTYSLLMAPIFPLELSWASVNCRQNTSFLFRPLTVINIKRHLSKGFAMAALLLGLVAVEIALHPLAPLRYLTYQFNNLSSAPCVKDVKDDVHISCC